MDNLERKILNKLIDKYESSKLSKGGTVITKKIKLTTKDEVLNTYEAIDSYKFVEENDAVIKHLETLNFIFVERSYETFKALTLNLGKIKEIYLYLGRENPIYELDRIRMVLNKFSFDNFVGDFVDYIKEYISNKYDYPKSYFNDFNQLELILMTFSKLFELDEETKKRDFSVRYLGDSKLFESIQGKIIKIIREFDSNEYVGDEELLASYNIIKNTSYALIKNKLVFSLNDVIIDLDKLSFEFSLSDEMIKIMKIMPSSITKVITVENLTSFYSINEKDALIIYLAGFHNHTKQILLKKIYSSYPNANYYHFGDIDAGGFWIYHTLKEKTNIPFVPYRMNVEELTNHKDSFKRLTDNDKKRLSKMVYDTKFEVFKETIEFMLINNVKLEQEILD